METKIKVLSKHIKGSGSKLIGYGEVTDSEINYYGWGNREKKLKFVVVKGFAEDWCIYLERMDVNQTIEEVMSTGNKIQRIERIKYLVDCSANILRRYRK